MKDNFSIMYHFMKQFEINLLIISLSKFMIFEIQAI